MQTPPGRSVPGGLKAIVAGVEPVGTVLGTERGNMGHGDDIGSYSQ